MTHWKLILAYDGTPFHGWQVQPGLLTIQGMLADAIYRTVGEPVLPQGSGRTDSGVHALGQVASFALAAPIPPGRLQFALNRCLPPSIRILSAELVPPDFHARHSALRKTYEYRIFPLRAEAILDAGVPHPSRSDRDGWDVNPPTASGRICPPTLAPFVWPCPWPLDLAALNQAARHVLGIHDFNSFAASDPDLATRTTTDCTSPAKNENCHSDPELVEGEESPHFASPTTNSLVRTIFRSCWHAEDGLLIYRVTANGFLHHMVRNLVGTFVQAGAHRLDPDSIPALLAARNRSATGPTAPPTGLFLVSVEYPHLEPGALDLEPGK
jgi:tRNA pseudouridine38-40 synthase